MYESPVTIMMNEIMDSITEQREDMIVSKISETIGLDIDKQELVKALKYDRNQYEKGYADAKAEFSMDKQVKALIYYPEDLKTEYMKKVEEALGFKLFVWQWEHILHGSFILGRRCGKSLAENLRVLLMLDKPILEFRRPRSSSEKFRMQQLVDLKEKLDAAGIHTTEIKWL